MVVLFDIRDMMNSCQNKIQLEAVSEKHWRNLYEPLLWLAYISKHWSVFQKNTIQYDFFFFFFNSSNNVLTNFLFFYSLCIDLVLRLPYIRLLFVIFFLHNTKCCWFELFFLSRRRKKKKKVFVKYCSCEWWYYIFYLHFQRRTDKVQ